jgi:hypothetical protein
MQKCLSKSGCAKAYGRIVGKAETLLRPAKRVAQIVPMDAKAYNLAPLSRPMPSDER